MLKSSITIEDEMEERRLNPIHPGQILLDEFVVPSDKPHASIAAVLGLTQSEFDALLQGDLDVSPAIAKALAQVWDTTPQFWLNLQRDYERRTAATARQ